MPQTPEERKERNREAVRRWKEKNKPRAYAVNKIWRQKNYQTNWMTRIKQRCKRNDIEFNLTIEDFDIPEICPALGIPIIINDPNKLQSPSMDRIKADQGYTKGNVRVISYRANQVKSNSTVEEMEKVLQYYKDVSS